MPALRAAMRTSPIASASSGARSASTLRGRVDILEDVGDRILVLVAQQLGQALGQALDAVDQLRRAVEQCAEPARRSTGRPGSPAGRVCVIGGLPRTAPSSWISLTPVKPTPWICAVVP